MDWTSLISPGANLVGGYLNSKASSDAAQKASDSTLAAAQIAADAAKFRPVGVTSRFGSSGFQYDANGNLVGAGYNLSPDAAAYRDRMMAGASGDMAAADQASGAAQGMFRLGSQYLSGDPAGDWMRAQQNLLAPSRERQLAGVRSNLFATGRTGLAVGGTGARPDGSAGLGASNPEMEAYFNAIAQQDAGLATQAQQQGRDAVTFGSGLFSNGMNLLNTRYSPALASIGGANTIEGLGQSTLDMGAQLGGRGASAGAASGALLAAGARSAAPYQYQANSQSPAGNFFAGVGSNPSAATNLYSNIQGLWSGGSPQPSPYASWQTAGNGMPPGYDS